MFPYRPRPTSRARRDALTRCRDAAEPVAPSPSRDAEVGGPPEGCPDSAGEKAAVLGESVVPLSCGVGAAGLEANRAAYSHSSTRDPTTLLPGMRARPVRWWEATLVHLH